MKSPSAAKTWEVEVRVEDEIVAEGVDSGDGSDAAVGEGEAGAKGILKGGRGGVEQVGEEVAAFAKDAAENLGDGEDELAVRDFVAGGGGDAVVQTTGTGLVKPGILGTTIGTAGIAAIFAFSFLFASGRESYDLANKSMETVEFINSVADGAFYFADAALLTMMIMLGLSVAAIVYTEVSKMLK